MTLDEYSMYMYVTEVNKINQFLHRTINIDKNRNHIYICRRLHLHKKSNKLIFS